METADERTALKDINLIEGGERVRESKRKREREKRERDRWGRDLNDYEAARQWLCVRERANQRDMYSPYSLSLSLSFTKFPPFSHSLSLFSFSLYLTSVVQTLLSLSLSFLSVALFRPFPLVFFPESPPLPFVGMISHPLSQYLTSQSEKWIGLYYLALNFNLWTWSTIILANSFR